MNQCPISAGNSFLYDFTAADQAGTFWYHSHLSTQYCDGLRGPMVVYDPDDPYLSMYELSVHCPKIVDAPSYRCTAYSSGVAT